MPPTFTRSLAHRLPTLLACLVPWAGAVVADEPAEPAAATGSVEPILSLYDDDLRCFRFRLPGAVITHDAAYAFTIRFDGEILGAFPDPDEEDVLCVVGPPETERAIRLSLAESLIETQGLGAGAFEMKRRELTADRRGLIQDIGLLEIDLAGLTADDTTELEAKRSAMNERIASLEAELTVVERQLTVLARAAKRLEEAESETE